MERAHTGAGCAGLYPVKGTPCWKLKRVLEWGGRDYDWSQPSFPILLLFLLGNRQKDQEWSCNWEEGRGRGKVALICIYVLLSYSVVNWQQIMKTFPNFFLFYPESKWWVNSLSLFWHTVLLIFLCPVMLKRVSEKAAGWVAVSRLKLNSPNWFKHKNALPITTHHEWPSKTLISHSN